ncbi:MAG TPA: ABC transporter permease [Vicinamibacterales bacterium]|nr:ABC transporter permease [Vicinamibacterales bacterium]
MTRILRDAARDLLYALRGRWIGRGPAVMAVLSLALGIGGSVAIWSLVDVLLVRPLPVENPASLVVIERRFERGTADYITYPAFERYRDAGIFDTVTASMIVERSGVRLNGDASRTATLRVGLVAGNYFSTLGVRAAAGRLFGPDDDRVDGAGTVAVISAPCWQREFGGKPDAIGGTFTIGTTTLTVIGVANTPFVGENVGEVTDVWVPVSMQSQVVTENPGLRQSASSNWIRAIARLRPGQSLEQAQSAAQAVFAGLPATSTQFGPAKVVLEPAGRGFSPAREIFGAPLAVLASAVTLVLLMACGNVAMLVLAGTGARRKEIAVRLAIGASRGRLARQLVIENALLAGVSCLAGLFIAIWLTKIVSAIAATGRMSITFDVHADTRLLGITAFVGLITVLIVGVAPAARAARTSLTPAISGSGNAARGTTLRGGKLLVVGQIAASVALLITAVLFLRTLRNLETEDVGFERDRVWMFWMSTLESGRQGQALASLFSAAHERLATMPGVLAASLSTDGVLSGFIGLRAVTVPGRGLTDIEDSNAEWNIVGPNFFDAVGMRVLAGRDFGPSDTDTAPRVAVVNETMAHRFFADANPIGKQFSFGREINHPIEIVGVVRDAKYFSARDEPVPMVFLPYQQDVPHLFRMCVVVRLASDTPALVTRIREALAGLDPAVPVRLVNTTTDQLGRSLSQERVTAWFAGFFGSVAAILACAGVFGVMSQIVTRRTREIGVRIALGESRAGILARVLRQSVALAAAGIAIGVPVAWLSARAARSLLFGVSPADPASIAASAVLLLCVAIAATIVPARRAATTDPIVALRTE